MTKNGFLDKLRVALSGKVSASLLKENMTYYNEYIDTQIRMGKSEQEVMDMLGDPRLIARTIVQTNGISTDSAEGMDYRESSSYGNPTSYDNGSYRDAHGNGGYKQNTNNSGGYNNDGSYYSGQNHEVKVRTIPAWMWAIIMIVIAVCVISIIFSVVSFMLPLILPILIVVFFVKLFRDWLN